MPPEQKCGDCRWFDGSGSVCRCTMEPPGPVEELRVRGAQGTVHTHWERPEVDPTMDGCEHFRVAPPGP